MDKVMDVNRAIELKKALVESDNTLGGYLTEKEVIEKLIPQLKEYGAVRSILQPMKVNSNKIEIPLSTLDPSVAWVDENNEVPASDMNFNRTSANIYKLAGRVIYTDELSEDAFVNVKEVIAQRLLMKVAYKEDISYLFGDSSLSTTDPYYSKFDGIATRTPSSNIVYNTDDGTAAGTPEELNLDNIFDALEKIEEVGGKPDTMVMHPKVFNQLRKLKDSNGRLIFDNLSGVGNVLRSPRDLNPFGVNIYVTDVVPTASGESEVLIFDSKNVGYLLDRRKVNVEVWREPAYQRENYILAERIGYLPLHDEVSALIKKIKV